MRFTIDKEALMKGLTLVSKAIPPKAEIPILSNFKLDMTERGLEITGSDNNITILPTYTALLKINKIKNLKKK